MSDSSITGAETIFNDISIESKLLAILPKGPAVLSILSSSAIVIKISHKTRNDRSVLDRIMLGLSITDIVISINYFLGTWLIPSGSTSDKFGPIYGAIGNDATCQLSGFFAQYAVASTMYNAALATYFLLTIRYNKLERDIEKVEHWFHVVPISFAVFTSSFPLIFDMYESVGWICWIRPDPIVTPVQKAFKLIQWLFLFAPIWICLFYQSTVMHFLFRKIRLFEKDMQKYSFTSVSKSFRMSSKKETIIKQNKAGMSSAPKGNNNEVDFDLDEYNDEETNMDFGDHKLVFVEDGEENVVLETSNNGDDHSDSSYNELYNIEQSQEKAPQAKENIENLSQSRGTLRFSTIADYIPPNMKEEEVYDDEWRKSKVSKTLGNLVRKAKRRLSTTSSINSADRKQMYKHFEKSRLIATQGILYVCAFYITWLFPTIMRFLEFCGSYSSVIQILDATLLPMQGFFNCLIYLRPRVLSFRKANPEVGFWKALWTIIYKKM